MKIARYLTIIISILLSVAAYGSSHNESTEEMKAKADALYNADRFVEAFDLYTLTMKRADSEGDELMRERCLGNIANIYGFFGDYERANVYFEKALKDAVANKHNDVAAKCVINMVVTYSQMGQPERAKEYFAIQNRISLSDSAMRQFFFYQSQAYIAFAEKHYSLCRSINRHAWQFALQKDLPMSYVASLHNDIGRCFQLEGMLDSAIVAYRQNMELCQRAGIRKYLAESYQNLANAYRAKGDRQSMIEYQSLYMAQNDTIFGEKQFNMAKDRLFKYETDKTDAQIRMLNTRFSRALIGAIIVAVLLIAVTVLALVIHKKNRRLHAAYVMLYNKNRELMSSHDESRQLRQQYATATTSKLLQDINAVMEDVNIISRQDFSITSLADAVGSNVKTVSAVINDTYGKNFKTYLNEYRVREACRRLADNEAYGNLTIKAIAESVGYNSINNFIIAFKRIVGMTPSAYQKVARMGEQE